MDAFQASVKVLVNNRTNAGELHSLAGSVTEVGVVSPLRTCFAISGLWSQRGVWGCAVGSYSSPCWLPARSGAVPAPAVFM